MSVKTYILYCEICGYKRISDGTDIKDLVPYQQAAIPGGTPYIDPVTKKVVVPKSIQQSKKFKCPQCGRLITARKVSTITQPGFEGEDNAEKNIFT